MPALEQVDAPVERWACGPAHVDAPVECSTPAATSSRAELDQALKSPLDSLRPRGRELSARVEAAVEIRGDRWATLRPTNCTRATRGVPVRAPKRAGSDDVCGRRTRKLPGGVTLPRRATHTPAIAAGADPVDDLIAELDTAAPPPSGAGLNDDTPAARTMTSSTTAGAAHDDGRPRRSCQAARVQRSAPAAADIKRGVRMAPLPRSRRIDPR